LPQIVGILVPEVDQPLDALPKTGDFRLQGFDHLGDVPMLGLDDQEVSGLGPGQLFQSVTDDGSFRS
jgi:hypothetical protein